MPSIPKAPSPADKNEGGEVKKDISGGVKEFIAGLSEFNKNLLEERLKTDDFRILDQLSFKITNLAQELGIEDFEELKPELLKQFDIKEETPNKSGNVKPGNRGIGFWE